MFELKSVGTKILETDRLILRRFEKDDANNMFNNYASNPNVTKFLTWQPHKTVKDSENIINIWINEYSNLDFYQWCIELKEIKQIIGSISVVNIWKEMDKCEIGYCLSEEYWHKGITSEALKKIIEFLFNVADAKTIVAKHDVNNINSGLVMKKCGMEFQCIIKKATKNSNGDHVDCAYYEIKNN